MDGNVGMTDLRAQPGRLRWPDLPIIDIGERGVIGAECQIARACVSVTRYKAG